MSHHKVSVFSVAPVAPIGILFCIILAIKPPLPHYRISWAYICICIDRCTLLYVSIRLIFTLKFLYAAPLPHLVDNICKMLIHFVVFICSAKPQISSQHWRKFQFIILLLIHLLLKIKLCIVERVLLSVPFKFIIGCLRVNE